MQTCTEHNSRQGYPINHQKVECLSPHPRLSHQHHCPGVTPIRWVNWRSSQGHLTEDTAQEYATHCGMQRNSIQKAAKRSSNTCTCTDCYGFRKFLQFWHGHYKITGKWQVSIFPALSKQKPQNSSCFDKETIQMHTSAANSKVFLADQFDNVFKYK